MNARYEEELGKLKERIQKSGDFEKALLIQEEINRIRSEQR